MKFFANLISGIIVIGLIGLFHAIWYHNTNTLPVWIIRVVGFSAMRALFYSIFKK